MCDFVEDKIRRTFETATPFEGEFKIDGPYGEKRLNWRLIPEFDQDGTVKTLLSISRDITEQRKKEKEYEILFREMLDGFALHEIICDDEGRPIDYRFLAVNPAFERLTGLKAADIVGRTVLEVLPGTEKYWIDTYGKVALTGEPTFFENFSAELNSHFEVTAFRHTLE